MLTYFNALCSLHAAPILAGTWAAVMGGADAAHGAAMAVASKQAPTAFALTRPPGHHAGADFKWMYCFINNAVVAAQMLLNQGVKRVAILDLDFHRGNGTQSIVYDRSDVVFVSIHGDPKTEYPFYLGHADETGQGAGAEFNLNFLLAAGSGALEWFNALDITLARIHHHSVDAVVILLGMDTYADAPICKFGLIETDFGQLGRALAKLKLPAVFVFEGGHACAELALNTLTVIECHESATEAELKL